MAMFAVVFFVSCEKESFGPFGGSDGPVVRPGRADFMSGFVLRFPGEVQTKGTDINILPSSLYWGGVHHKQDGTFEIPWSCSLGAVETDPSEPSRKIIVTGGQKADNDQTIYDFYVSNFSFDLSPSASNILNVTQNSVDVLVGFASVSGNSIDEGVDIRLEHIFAKTGTLSFPNTDVYEFSNLTWKIIGKGEMTGTRGAYNMSTGNWISSTAPLTTARTITSSSNFYVIPGVYTFKVNGTIRSKASGKVETFEVSSDVELLKGMRNNIIGKLSSSFINDWEDKGDIILD